MEKYTVVKMNQLELHVSTWIHGKKKKEACFGKIYGGCYLYKHVRLTSGGPRVVNSASPSREDPHKHLSLKLSVVGITPALNWG